MRGKPEWNTARWIGCLLAWLAVVLWMSFIYSLSAKDVNESEKLSGGVASQVIDVVKPDYSSMSAVDKVATKQIWKTVVAKTAHLAEYALLGVLLWMAMGFHLSHRWWRSGLAVGVGLLYGISDEVHQLFVEGRGAGVWDVGIDFIGGCIGVAIAAVITRWWQKRKA